MHQCLKFILFGRTLYIFRAVFSPIIRSFKTVHTAIDICQSDTAVFLLLDRYCCLLAVRQILLSSCCQTDTAVCLLSDRYCCLLAVRQILLSAFCQTDTAVFLLSDRYCCLLAVRQILLSAS